MSRRADFSTLQELPAISAAFAGASPPEISSRRRALQAKLFRRHLIRPDQSVAHFADSCRPADRDFIQSVAAVHNQRTMKSQHAECLGKLLDKLSRIHSYYLAGGLRRIGQRAEQIEHRPQMQLAACRLHDTSSPNAWPVRIGTPFRLPSGMRPCAPERG